MYEDTKDLNAMGALIVKVFLSLLGAALAQVVALGLAGAGHGWNEPFKFTFALWMIFPIVVARSELNRAVGWGQWTVHTVLAVLAVTLDAALIFITATKDQDGFVAIMNIAPVFVAAWVLIWLVWQFIIARDIIRGILLS